MVKHKKTGRNKKDEPNPRQKALALLLTANPNMPMHEALALAKYSPAAHKVINTKGFKSLRELYQAQLVDKISPILIAKRIKEGIKSKDLRVVLPYIQEYKKDLNISVEAGNSVAIQVNLSGEVSDLAE